MATQVHRYVTLNSTNPQMTTLGDITGEYLFSIGVASRRS